MKKLLSMLGAIGLVATSSASVVACGSKAGDSDASGPSSDDVAKWDAMEIKEFENTFESAVANILGDDSTDSQAQDFLSLAQKINDIVSPEENGGKLMLWTDSGDWKTKDTKDFENLFNHFWSKEYYDLFNYGIERIHTDDRTYKFLSGKRDDGSSGDKNDLSVLKNFLVLFEDDKSPVKDIKSFSKWDELISKAKDLDGKD